MSAIDRRELLSGLALGGLGFGLAGEALGAPGDIVATKKSVPIETIDNIKVAQLCRTRPNVGSLTAAQLDAIRTGITVMQGRAANDPTSWSYQAAIHGSGANPQLTAFSTCEHGTLHFLSWHRLYLRYFERILRAASGSPTLMLPYWNWTANRDIPAPFRSNFAGNPLFVANRNNAMNAGGLLPASSVTYASDFLNIPFDDFSGGIEGSPHGAVHVSVGGGMASFNTAGLDPLFWLHHCNIDRLWVRWLQQGGGRANPNDAAWKNETFTFFDVGGVQRSVKASAALSTCGLGYKYPEFRVVVSKLVIAVALSQMQVAKLKPRQAVEAQGPVVLVPRGSATRVPIGPVQGAIGKAGAMAGGPRVLLSFDDIKVTDPEGYYEIYLNPARPAGLTADDPSYAGNLVLFGLTEADRAGRHGRGDHGEPRRVFDITNKLAELRSRQRIDPRALNVVLVLRLPEPPPGATAMPVSDKPRGEIGRIRVLVQ